ncbi:hypothetical protein LUZ60_017062 [Juncus effusus]|nr:hypothetical protein LUZ60_017062 [Juncus effusus]
MANNFLSFSFDGVFFLLIIFSISLPTFAFDTQNSQVVNLRSLTPSDVCTSQNDLKGFESGKTKLRLTHRYGPCSPLEPLEKKPSHEQILSQDQSRVDSIHQHITAVARQVKISELFSTSKIVVQSGDSFDVGNYVVSIGIGTPVKNFHVIIDTGSDVTWIQCEPCIIYCYPQQDPLFEPSKSSTYSNISCTSSYCTDLDVYNCSDSTCVYSVGYGDQSYTVGFYGEDTLTLTSSDIIPNFRFGCGEKDNGTFGKVAGLLGLGREKSSFVSQTSDKYGEVFAYCLPAASSSTGYLTFGSGSPMSKAKYTPLAINPINSPAFYYLEITGIKVGDEQLLILPTVFTIAGTIIDSGTVITRLPPDAYSALRDSFKKQMMQYKSAPAFSLFDTCYDFTGLDNVTIPTIEIEFLGNVSLNLEPTGILYEISISQVCLAFAGNESPTALGIFGNVQQGRFNVVYDVRKGVVGFSPQAC